MSRSWVTRLVARWRIEGDAAFEPRSRRPDASPSKTPDEVLERIVELRRTALVDIQVGAAPDLLGWRTPVRG